MVNRRRLLWAGFTAILAAGVGFAVRGLIFDNWADEFGFTGKMLGEIGGAGFSGFCFGIIIGGVICDKIGYGKLVIAAFVLHFLSAFVAFGATPAMDPETGKLLTDQSTAFQLLLWAMFIFAFANGTLEAVANPLVATLYPEDRTHNLNLLHASWPGGMILGAVIGYFLDDLVELHWKYQLALYLIPTVAYGLMFLGQVMPKSEASEKGLGLGEMFKDIGLLGAAVVCFLLALFLGGNVFSQFMPGTAATVAGYVLAGGLLVVVGVITKGSVGSILLFVLFIAHALVGAVELGTDQWIMNISGNLFSSEYGKFLFIWASVVMFALRFCAHFIEKRMGISPMGILLSCAVLASLGLVLFSSVTVFWMAVLAITVYAVGKTFFWPTMLAVASDRFPRTGAVAISVMGGIGMLSAGLIGAPGLGYAKDRFAAEALEKKNAALYAAHQAEKPSKFLRFKEAKAIEPGWLTEAQGAYTAARKELAKEGIHDPAKALEKITPDQRSTVEASAAGDRKTLMADAVIPAIMALLYLGILVYFKVIGGYKPVTIEGEDVGADDSGEDEPTPAEGSGGDDDSDDDDGGEWEGESGDD